MGWLDAFSARIVGVDTAPLIYFIEEREYADTAMHVGEDCVRDLAS